MQISIAFQNLFTLFNRSATHRYRSYSRVHIGGREFPRRKYHSEIQQSLSATSELYLEISNWHSSFYCSIKQSPYA